MPNQVGTSQVIRFATFEVDLQAQEVRKAGLRLKLTGQPFQVLAILLEQPGTVVTREELQKRLWPDTFVDVDHNLNTAINKIREALGDSSENPRFVETLPRRGYRFIGELNVRTPPEETAAVWPQRRLIWSAVVASIAVIAILAFLIFVNVRGWRDRLFAPSSQIQALAVLPFENPSSAPEQEYFCDGMTEALITELGRLGGPRVISRRSIMQFKGSKKSLQQIARDLAVDAIVEGTVKQTGDRVLVTVHLEQAFPERQLWANRYDRTIHDAPTLQSEIARAVADQIKVKITPERLTALAENVPSDSEAHLEYLRGLYFEHKDTELDLRTAVGHFEKALEKEPTYAPAHAELAMTYFLLGRAHLNGPAVKETQPLANAAVAKALQIDASLPRAHLALGLLMTNEWNWPEAERQYQLSLSLDPNCADCHHQYGALLQVLGRTEDAVTHIQHAIELDPLDEGHRLQLAFIAFTSRQYDLAISRYEELHSSRPPLAWSYAQKGMYEKATATAKNCENSLGGALCVAELAYVYGMAGKKREAKHALNQLTEISNRTYVYPTRFAIAYLGLDKNQALAWLERAYDEKDPALFFLYVGPVYDPLRPEPRFQALLRKLNFPT